MASPPMTPAQIASKLTKAQRALLLSIGTDWMVPPHDPLAPDAMRGWASKKFGLLESKHDQTTYYIRLTPLGLSVRAAIQASEGEG